MSQYGTIEGTIRHGTTRCTTTLLCPTYPGGTRNPRAVVAAKEREHIWKFLTGKEELEGEKGKGKEDEDEKDGKMRNCGDREKRRERQKGMEEEEEEGGW